MPEQLAEAGRRGGAGRWSWLAQRPVQLGLIVLVGLGLYLHTLKVPFIFDDVMCIRENPAVRSFAYFVDFDRVRELGILEDIKNNFALRYVAYLTFALNYWLGSYDVVGYHLVNIAIHLCNAVLVYLLMASLVKRMAPARPDAAGCHALPFVPLLVALLFVAHPLQTQAVTYISQRFTILLAFFYLATLLLYVVARAATTTRRRRWCYGFALLAALAAMKTQESAFTLPFMLLLVELFFLPAAFRQRLAWLWPFFLAAAIIPATLFWLTASNGGSDPRSPVEQSVNLVNFSGISQWDYLVTQFGVIVTYLRMLVVPSGQNIIPAYPLASSFFTLPTMAAFFLLLALLTGAVRLALGSFKAGRVNAARVVAFGILWFFVTIAMSSSIIPLEAMMLEYRVYLPSIGFFLALAVAAVAAVDRGWISAKVLGVVAVFAILALAAATVDRNFVYLDKVRLMRDILAKNPAAIGARIEIAGDYLTQRRFAEAEAELVEILRVLPNDSNMVVNLGYALAGQGRLEEALAYYRKALALNANNAAAHCNLAFAYLEMGLIPAAEEELLVAVAIDPNFGAARFRLALLYDELGLTDRALEHYRELLRAYPSEPVARARVEQAEAQLRAR